MGTSILRVVAIAALGTATVTVHTRPQPAAPAGQRTAQHIGGGEIPGSAIQPVASAVVSFADLALEEAARAAAAPPDLRGIGMSEEGHDRVTGPNVSSPMPKLSYKGLDDIPQVDPPFHSFIPPETQGAVGRSEVFVTLSNNYGVQDKATGSTISIVSMASFWAPTGAIDPFEPRTVYDPYNDRWIVSAVSDAMSPNTSILIGISNTSRPTGTWTLFRFLACGVSTGPCGPNGSVWWANSPAVGFNRNWAAVSVNMIFGFFQQSRMLVLDYRALRSGSAFATMITGIADRTVVPVATYSNTEDTLYAPTDVSSAGTKYRLNTITGTPGYPVYTQGVLKSHTLVSGWLTPAGDILPQLPEPVTGLVKSLHAGDSAITNAIFRNGNIWYAQSVGLPGDRGPLPTHVAAQWIRLDTNGDEVDAGRVEDLTATSTNGGKWYAFPTIAVNVHSDVLLGFSQFSSAQYPSAGYALRAGSDPPGTMRDPVISRAGIGFYYKTFGGLNNEWGRYSAAQVDPSDDESLWTLQEYSDAQVGTGDGSGRWSTWWVKVAVNTPPAISAIPSQATTVNTPVVVNFTVNDAESGPEGVTVTGTSTNTALVPASNIVISGSSASRTATITPASGQAGTTRIFLTASDGSVPRSTVFFSVDVAAAGAAVFDSTLKAPTCADPGWLCDTGSLVVGRDTIAGGNEPNQPNTINNSCADGAKGAFHRDESIDRVKVWTLDHGPFAPGAMVRIDVTVWAFAFGFTDDHLDLYYASKAASPAWTRIATLTPTIPGLQTLSATYLIPNGEGLQAVRAAFRYDGLFPPGTPSPCTTGSLSVDDERDDLVFRVEGEPLRALADFDGDGKSDPTVYRPSTGGWHSLHSSTNYTTSSSMSWGLSTDTVVPGDYDGDGKADPAIFRPSIGLWAILKSSTGYTTSTSVSWGLSTDIPAPGDFDGDGKADPAVFRPSTGGWYFLKSSTSYSTSGGISWGLSTDVPLPADYDGDGKADPAIFRPSAGLWAILKSSTGYSSSTNLSWGTSTDVPVPGDYDGDGKTDPAIFRPSTGLWAVLQSSTGYTRITSVSLGLSTDIPVPGDFDGDRKTDPAIFRPSTGAWATLTSSTAYGSATSVMWGLSTDTPILMRR